MLLGILFIWDFRMKKIFVKLTLLIIIVVILVIPLHNIFMNNYVDPDNDYKNKFYNVPYNIEICNFGSSHGQMGFNYSDIKNKYICFNFALTGQALSYDYRILEYYKEHIKEGAYIFIPVGDFVLFGEKRNKIDGYKSKNKRYYYFLPPHLIENFSLVQYIYTKAPWLCCSDNEFIEILLNNNDEKVEIEKHEGTTNYLECQKDTKNRTGKRILYEGEYYYYKKINYQELESLYNIINLCKEIKAKPIIVTMPMTGAYSDTVNRMNNEFFDVYYDLINKIANETGVVYVDYRYDERISDNYKYFINSDHMNDDGAKAFVNIILEEVIDK